MTIEANLVRLAGLYQAQVLFIRRRAAVAVGVLWGSTATGLDDEVLERFASAAARVSVAASTAGASAALAYVPAYVRLAGAEVFAAPGGPGGYSEPRGVPAVEVYRRPIVTARVAVSRGATFEDAMAAGRARAVQAVATDTVLANRAAARDAMAAQPSVVGYRRVPDATACQFCLLASTQRYHFEQLMPIHPDCGCSVAPIVGDRDPGRVIDRGLADRLMNTDPAAGIAVHEHGELGPVLYPAGAHFDAGP